MPAKRSLLPRPCPICGKSYGTMQVIIFLDYRENVTCRIGHYDAEAYKKIKKIHKTQMLNPANSNDHFQQEIRIMQRHWCSFRIDKNFAETHIIPLEDDIEFLEEGSGNRNFRKSITYSYISMLKDAIREKGWHKLPNYSDRYRRGVYLREEYKKYKRTIMENNQKKKLRFASL